MQPEQQRIMVYFIEEAKEHLQTIEHGLLNLANVVEDSELMNEVFRAAHSVKGGAAMLGLHSMQHIAHRLEDYFKVLKEHPIQVDQKLESLFFKSFDALSALTEELQTSFSLSDTIATQTLQAVEPVFGELGQYLQTAVGPDVDLSGVLEAVPPPLPTLAEPAPLDSALVDCFQTEVLAQIRELLRLFQQPEDPIHRSRLSEVCQTLVEVGQAFNLPRWQELLEKTQTVIAHPDNAFYRLAPIVIPMLKTAQELVLDQKADQIAPPDELLTLLPAIAPAGDIDWLSLFDEGTPATPTPSEADAFLDALLDDPALDASEAPAVPFLGEAVATVEPIPVPNFAALAALLEVATPPALEEATITPSLEVDLTADSDFEDLEKLLDETHKGSARPESAPSRPPMATSRRANFSQTMKVPVKQLDNLSNLVGELVVSRNTLEDGQERLRQFLDNLLFQVQQLGELGQTMEDLYERSLLERSLLSLPQYQSSEPSHNGTGSPNGRTGHASGAKFDALEMDSFTKFHILSQEIIERIVRVREAAADIEFIVEGSDQVTRMLRQVTTQVQEGLTRSRMVPFTQVAERLPRAVRDISLKCGKQARLDLEGRDTLIDKSILERLYDPLTHLVNNAIYHGIESPDLRMTLGKPTEGVIKIRAFYQGNQAVIAISDDGAGIDLDRIKSKAIQKQLVTPDEAVSLSRQEVYNLLFTPGFSTNDAADDLAGRGVGMDVVRNSILESRGTITTDSALGKGTTFTIRLPLTLSITKALCCVDHHCRIAFPIDGVQDVVDLLPEQVQYNNEGQPVLFWRDQQVLGKPLGDLLSYNRLVKRSQVYSGQEHNRNQVSFVILRSADDLVAIQVEEVLGEQEIVIKQLGGPVPKPMGIAGVTVLGDGRIMPIVDVLELIDLSLDRLELSRTLWQGDLEMPDLVEHTEPTVLIVDDSITVRELLSMTFTKAGYRVEQARDGLEAWEKLRSGLPCELVFCDVEMPRMDGLELLSRLQQDEDLQDLPVAMLTSRGAARHKQMAAELGAKGYFTKPYMEEVLLDAARRMMEGEVLVK
jgi:chemosensory pili system protein ChpA (sensor histidine kinase/response regulator)